MRRFKTIASVLTAAPILLALIAYASLSDGSAAYATPPEEQAEWHDIFLGEGIFGSTPTSIEVFEFAKEQVPDASSGNPSTIIKFMTGFNPWNDPTVSWGNAKGFNQYKWDAAYMSREAPASACGIWYENHTLGLNTSGTVKQSCASNVSYIHEEEALLNLTVDMTLDSWTASKPLSPNIKWNSTSSQWYWAVDEHRWVLHQMVFNMNEMGCSEFNDRYPDINSKLLEVMNDHSLNQEYGANHYLSGEKQHFGITC